MIHCGLIKNIVQLDKYLKKYRMTDVGAGSAFVFHIVIDHTKSTRIFKWLPYLAP